MEASGAIARGADDSPAPRRGDPVLLFRGMSPQSIAHYRIASKLGEGGMGAVYRATDTRLSRDVAIKVLPDTFASDPDRLARFTREAQVLASLNHPKHRCDLRRRRARHRHGARRRRD